jgi:hypothetical protein
MKSKSKLSMTEEIVIIAYLGEKLGVEEKWFVTPSEVFFGDAPIQVVHNGDGEILIEWLEERLGLRPGQAF